MREVIVGQVWRWDFKDGVEGNFVITHVSTPAQEASYKYLNSDFSASAPLVYFDSDAVLVNDAGEAPEADAVNHPSHYTSDPSGVECIQITRHRNFNIGNAIKYLWRAGLKEDASLDNLEKEIQDLEKAAFYIQDEIKRKRGE